MTQEKVQARRIYLVRHGEARYTKPDAERSLTTYGQLQAISAARFLCRAIDARIPPKGPCRIHVISSGFRRAEETAQILIDGIKKVYGDYVDISHSIDPVLQPGGDYEAEADYFRFAPDELPGEVILVTHMPFVAELAYALGDNATGCFKNCEVAIEEEIPVDDEDGVIQDGAAKVYRHLGHFVPDDEIVKNSGSKLQV